MAIRTGLPLTGRHKDDTGVCGLHPPPPAHSKIPAPIPDSEFSFRWLIDIVPFGSTSFYSLRSLSPWSKKMEAPEGADDMVHIAHRRPNFHGADHVNNPLPSLFHPPVPFHYHCPRPFSEENGGIGLADLAAVREAWRLDGIMHAHVNLESSYSTLHILSRLSTVP